MVQKELLSGRVIVLTGDITEMQVEAVVNAANSSLLGGGGVDGAIHRKGGPEILKQCRELRNSRFGKGLPTGEAAVTGGGRLPARYVIHTVGPVWQGGQKGEVALLENCYVNSLKEASALNVGSIAFPAISTGIYGFPRELAARIVMKVLKKFVTSGNPMKIFLVFFSEADYRVFLDNCGEE